MMSWTGYAQLPQSNSFPEQGAPERSWSGTDAILVTSTWINNTGGSWGDSGNWSAGVPGSGDDVVFSSGPAAKTITLGQNRSVRSVTFNSTQTGAVTLSGFVLTLSPSSNGGTTLLVDAASGDHFISSSLQLAGQDSQVFSIGSDRLLTISGNIAGSTPSRSFTKTGAGTLLLTGNTNTYSGGTTISAGTLELSGLGTLGATTGSLTVNGGTLNLGGTNQAVGALNGSGGTILNNATGTSSTLTVGTGDTSGSYAGVIRNNTSGTGTVSLLKTGTGDQTLTGTNLYTGGTTVQNGRLIAGVGSLLSVGGTIAVNGSGSTLMLSGTGNHIGDNLTVSLGGGTYNTNGLSETIGALTLTSTSTLDLGIGMSIANNGAGNLASGTLNILNWSGALVTGGGTDQVIFSNAASQFTNVIFVNPDGLAAGNYIRGARDPQLHGDCPRGDSAGPGAGHMGGGYPRSGSARVLAAEAPAEKKLKR